MKFDNLAMNLEILAEECAEVIKVKSKIIRFGLNEYHPADPAKTTNKELLEEELGHIMAMVDILATYNNLDYNNISIGSSQKLIKLEKFYDYQNGLI